MSRGTDLAVGALLFSAALAMTAHAQSSSGMMGGNPMMGAGAMMGGGIRRLLQVPDLSDAQRRQLVDRQRELQRRLLQLQGKALDARFALEDAGQNGLPVRKWVWAACRVA